MWFYPRFVRVAVVGAGVVGMSAAVALLDAGQEVCCFKPAAIMGERSVGSTRIFRLAHVDADLVRCARQAGEGFARWSKDSGRPTVVRSECVITGSDMAARATAMAKAGVDYELVGAGSGRLCLAVVNEPAAALVDVGGGVVDVDAVRDYITARAGAALVQERVFELAIADTGTAAVTTARGQTEYDVVILAAGASTSNLAAQVGVYTPPQLTHHVRFTFRVGGDGWQSWIDKPPDEVGTYQHQAGPALWAVGGYVDPNMTAWDVGRDAAVEASRVAALNYVRSRLTVDPAIVDSVYCTTLPNLGDGVEFRRRGSIVAIYGDNLMKFAPVLGEALADAAIDGTTPTVTDLVAA